MVNDENPEISRLQDEIAGLRQQVAGLESLRSVTSRTEQLLERQTHDLRERVKELNCLYEFSKLVTDESPTLATLFHSTVRLIPGAWRHCDIATAQIVFQGETFQTEPFRTGDWVQTADIKVFGEKAGELQVYYTEERPKGDEGPFLNEERALLNVVAERLGVLIERHRTKEALRESEERYRTLVENLSIGVYRNTGGEQGKFLQANPAIARIFGYDSVEEFMNVAVSDLYVNREERHHFVSEITQKGSVHEKELRLRKKDGSVIWAACTARAKFDLRGELIWIDGVIEDITERKKAEEALRENEARFRTLVANIPGIIYRCACDENWTMEFISDAVTELTGYPASDLIRNQKRTYASVIHPEDRLLVERSVHDGVKEKKPYMIEYRIVHANGDIRWVYEKGQGIFGPGGEVLWLDGAIFDITERKKSEERLREQTLALEQKNMALKEILEQIEIEKKQIQDSVLLNAENLLAPLVERLKTQGVSRKYINLIQKNLQQLTSPFGRKISLDTARLTPREIEICNMVRNGFSSKEIAEFLHVSTHTVEKHRLNVRKKLGIVKKDFNLTSFLKSI